MPLVEKLWTGTLAQAALGIPLTDFDGGWCVAEVFTVSATVSGIEPSNGSLSIITYPGTEVAIGSDSGGFIGTLLTFTNNGDYREYATSNGNVTFTDGMMHLSVRVEANFIDLDAVVNLNVTISAGFPLDQYVEDPALPIPSDIIVDPGVEHFINLGWQHQYLLPDEVGFEIQKSTDDGETWETIALIPPPIVPADGDYTIELPAEIAIYRLRAYDPIAQTFSPWSTEAVVSEEPLTDLEFVPVGGIKLGSISVGEINQAGPIEFVMYSDPSGIYTLIPGQKFDRLYNRAGDEYVDVTIPNPFVKLGFLP
jgi:hypothetical protein